MDSTSTIATNASAAGPEGAHILHIVEPDAPAAGAPTFALACDLISRQVQSRLTAGPYNIDALILGSADAEARAARLGLHTHDRITLRTHWPAWCSLTAFHRYLRSIGQPNLMHCWSLDALMLAQWTAPSVPKILTLTTAPESRDQAQWLTMLCRPQPNASAAAAGITILTITNEVRRAWGQWGIDPRNIHTLRPGLDLARIAHPMRESLRREHWHIREADRSGSAPGTRGSPGAQSGAALVMAALGEPANRVDAARAARVLALACLSGYNAYMLIPPGAARRSVAWPLAAGGQCADRLIVCDELETAPWSVLGAVDVALVLDDHQKTSTDDLPPSIQGPVQSQAHHPDQTVFQSDHSLSRLSYLLRRRPRQERGAAQPGLLPMLWACCAGNVVIADATYAISELMEHQQSALVCPPGDQHAIVRRLGQILEDGSLRWSLSDRARTEAFSFYSMSRFVSDHQEVYRQMLEGAPVNVPDLPLTGLARFSAPTGAGSGATVSRGV